MSQTYTQIHLHTVFSVKNRESLIGKQWKEELYKYITGIVQNHNHKLLVINGMPDHLHLFLGLRPYQSLSALMQKIKGDSAEWINKKKLVPGRFSWQEGFGAFSISKSHVNHVIQYIHDQEIHHKKKTFLEEYKELLNADGVEFDERYIFKPVEY